MLISKPTEFSAFMQRLCALTDAGAPLCFDTEFLSEKRYYARLCLVQVLAQHGEEIVEGALDPFTLDLAPLLELIENPNIVKIVHSGSADLQILFQDFKVEAKNVFDTQIAGAFLGFGHQIGYADLVRRITGAQLSKTMQYTDWSLRPLSEEQIDYALADVRYLPPLYVHLKNELERLGRLSWAQAEFRRGEERAIRPEDDEAAYKRLNLSNLKPKHLAALRGLAALREKLAREVNRPTSFIIPDLALLQMARQQPINATELRGIRGMPALSKNQTDDFLKALDEAIKSPRESWPQPYASEKPDPRTDAIIALLGVVVNAIATAQGVSRSYLAPRDQLSQLAQWWLESRNEKDAAFPGIDLLTDWRYELVGRDLEALMNGEKVIALNPHTGLPELK